MRPLMAILAVVLLFTAASPALALKILVKIDPTNISKSGFKISVKENDDGLLVWTIERDLSKARSFPADSELTIVRTATVTLHGEVGIAAQFPLEPQSSAKHKNVLTYWFKTSRAMADHAHLTVSEIDDYKKNSLRQSLVGGGTIFELPLHELVKLPAPPDEKPKTP